MKRRPIKKVIPSRNLEPTSSNEVKSCSTGVISNIKKLHVAKPRKTTKSDIHFERHRSVVDFCTRCGDSTLNSQKNVSYKSVNSEKYNRFNDIETQISVDEERNKKKVSDKKKLIQQYYKNENFKGSLSSMKQNCFRNKALDPINESTEDHASLNDTSESVIEVCSESTEEIGFLDPEDDKNIKDLKDFRKDNYFECHSAKARVSSKGSVTSLNDHKCSYRFYLNDRLFPVPLNNDYKNIIRCVECHLPLEDGSNEVSINGTIQTKVKIGNDIQDLILMLPVKKPLIIQEKRALQDEKQKDVLYYGIVKLNYNGDSIFNANHPNDSLALRYQKGYKEFLKKERYMYEKIDENDVIII